MTDFPFISIENFTYSSAKNETEVSSEAEAYFCLNFKTLIQYKINPYKNE